MGRPKKQVILFIVEGKSDKYALERPIQKILQDYNSNIEAKFLVANQDVTSDCRNNPNNIISAINKFYFQDFFSSNDFYYPKDVIRVVQICDLDGTFIADQFCHEYDDTHKAVDGFFYDPPYIYGSTAEAVIDRNHRKAENIKFLLQQKTIKVISKSIAYSVYFFSSNIDHYLYDKYNISGREKILLAERFADECDNDKDYFVKRICQHSQAIHDKSFDESWHFVMEDGSLESIKRHTNFNFFINELIGIISDS